MNIPAGVPSLGTRRVVAIPAAANIDSITKTEITAGKNISCYLTRTGWQPTKDQDTIADGRYCSAQDFELPGTKKRQLMLQYIFNLHDTGSDVARITLPEGWNGILVHFFQKADEEDTFDVGDWYEAVPVLAGEQIIQAVEDNALDRINQKAFIRGTWTGLHQLVA